MNHNYEDYNNDYTHAGGTSTKTTTTTTHPRRKTPAISRDLSEKKLEDEASKKLEVLAQVKRVDSGLTARDSAFFSIQTSLV
jgi:hypothetical protein